VNLADSERSLDYKLIGDKMKLLRKWTSVLFLFCLAFAAPASATLMMYAEKNGINHYINTSEVERVGDFVRVWQTHNFRFRDSDGGMSRRAHYEYDCKQKDRTRILSIATHAGAMGSGEALKTFSQPGEWFLIGPNSGEGRFLQAVCK
jgi:hypothetical protein